MRNLAESQVQSLMKKLVGCVKLQSFWFELVGEASKGVAQTSPNVHFSINKY
jgi:hypothetical protein